MASMDRDGITHAFDDNVEDHCDGKVPNRGQFAPGKSGNPKGRPRKVFKQQSAIQSALSEVVTIKDAKGKRKVKAAVVIAKRLVQKGMAGDIAAIKELNAASPNFLTEVMKDESKFDGNDFLRHLVEVMTHDAVMEFRAAMQTWRHKVSGSTLG